jgi:DNA-binding transcriptional MerR regulator
MRSAQIDRLQQIMFFRELEVPLGDIKSILEQPGFHAETALLEHRKAHWRKTPPISIAKSRPIVVFVYLQVYFMV